MTGTSELKRGHLIVLQPQQISYVPQGISQLGLVVSGREYNSKTGSAVVTLVTDQFTTYPFAVGLSEGFAGRMVLADHVRRCSFDRYQVQVIDTIPPRITHQVLGKLGAIITI